MRGTIGQLIASPTPVARRTVREVFHPNFQTMGQWRAFLRTSLAGGSVDSQVQRPANQWTIRSFHALYVACWVHHPVEKGTYMLALPTPPVGDALPAAVAVSRLLSTRKSSHLTGKGNSASTGWKFLHGYEELLVQVEHTHEQPFLMLKCEGHTTGIKGLAPHLASYVAKLRTGEGNMASAKLHELATASSLVERRAAENYGKGYQSLLKALGFASRMTTVRQVLPMLVQKVGGPTTSARANTVARTGTNAEVGGVLMGIVEFLEDGPVPLAVGKTPITPGMTADLRALAGSLTAEGAKRTDRVFREIRVSAAEVDDSLERFYVHD